MAAYKVTYNKVWETLTQRKFIYIPQRSLWFPKPSRYQEKAMVRNGEWCHLFPALHPLSCSKHFFSIAILIQRIQRLLFSPSYRKPHFYTSQNSIPIKQWNNSDIPWCFIIFFLKKHCSCECFHWILGTDVQGYGAIAVNMQLSRNRKAEAVFLQGCSNW